MQGTFLQDRLFQLFFRLVVALSFALFVAYQVYLAINMEENRIGRLIGIGLYTIIAVALILAIFDNSKCRKAHSIVLVIGLVLLLGVKFINLPVLFGNLDFADIPSVLNCAVFILSELGFLILAIGYLMLLTDLTEKELHKCETVLMTIVIVLFVACFVMECVMLLKYHANIDQKLSLTLGSRVLFFIGFAGTAFSFLLPEPHREHKARPGEYIYSDDEEGEVDLII